MDKAANKEMQSENGNVVGMLGVTEFDLISEVVWVVVSEVVREVVSEVVREVVREVAREVTEVLAEHGRPPFSFLVGPGRCKQGPLREGRDTSGRSGREPV